MTDIQRMALPPAFMRGGETHEWPIAPAFPTKVLGFDDLTQGVQVEAIQIGARKFEAEELPKSTEYTYLPGEGSIIIWFKNTTADIVQRRGTLVLDQTPLHTAPTVPQAAAFAPSPAPPPGDPESELVAPIHVEREPSKPGSLPSNVQLVRMTSGQANVVRRLLRGQSVHPTERESVRIAFERSWPR